MQDLKEIPMDQKHREEFIDIFDRTREANGYEKIEKADIFELSTDKCNVISCHVNFEPKSVSYGWVSVLFEREGALYTFLICIHDANLGSLVQNTNILRILTGICNHFIHCFLAL